MSDRYWYAVDPGRPTTAHAQVTVSGELLRDGNTDVTPIIFTNLMGQLTRELDKHRWELAGPVTFHRGVKDSLTYEYVFRAEAPARPYGSRDSHPAPGIGGVSSPSNRQWGKESNGYMASPPGYSSVNSNSWGAKPPQLPDPPPYRWAGVNGTIYERHGDQTRVLPPGSPLSTYPNVGVDKSLVNFDLQKTSTPKKKESNVYSTLTVQTRAGYVGQVRTTGPDGDTIVVWESEAYGDVKPKDAKAKAEAAAEAAVRKAVESPFAGLIVTADEVAALLPDEKTAA